MISRQKNLTPDRREGPPNVVRNLVLLEQEGRLSDVRLLVVGIPTAPVSHLRPIMY